MPVILKIGYREYLVKRAKDAATVLNALADAVPVSSRYRNNREYYFPDSERRASSISMQTITADQLIASDPGEADIDGPVTRQHGDRERRLLPFKPVT